MIWFQLESCQATVYSFCKYEGSYNLKNSPVVIFIFFLSSFFFWLHQRACKILVPRPGIEPVSPAVEAQSPNHWTAREFP